MTHGDEAHFVLYVDGALLIELRDELELPEAIRRAWAPLIEANRRAPWREDVYVHGGEKRCTTVEVVGHADGP